jgi:hypothetical protein
VSSARSGAHAVETQVFAANNDSYRKSGLDVFNGR